jgi:hypothetical protein
MMNFLFLSKSIFFNQVVELDDDDDEDEVVEVQELCSGLRKAKQVFDNLGYTFERNLNERHPDTPSVRSAGAFYRLALLAFLSSFYLFLFAVILKLLLSTK